MQDSHRKRTLELLYRVLKNPVNRIRLEETIHREAVRCGDSGGDRDGYEGYDGYYRYLVYEVVEALRASRVETTDGSVSPTTAVRLYRDLRGGRHGRWHTRFEYIRRVFDEEENFLCNPPDIDEGVIQCSQCGSNKTYSFTKQIRRADESATVFVTCSKCRHNFRIG